MHTVRADKFRMELRRRVRKPGETLEKLHQDVRRCMALAFSDVDANARERLASDYFIAALNDPDFSLKVRERNPKKLCLQLSRLKCGKRTLRKRNMEERRRLIVAETDMYVVHPRRQRTLSTN